MIKEDSLIVTFNGTVHRFGIKTLHELELELKLKNNNKNNKHFTFRKEEEEKAVLSFASHFPISNNNIIIILLYVINSYSCARDSCTHQINIIQNISQIKIQYIYIYILTTQLFTFFINFPRHYV